MENEITYVLFGKEAVMAYKMSAKSLLDDKSIVYMVEKYSNVKDFVRESQNWDSFVEISKEDYEFLKSRSSNANKKKSFFNRLFKK